MKKPRKKYLYLFVLGLICLSLAVHHSCANKYPKVDYDAPAVEEFAQPVDLAAVAPIAPVEEDMPQPQSAASAIPDFNFAGVAQKEENIFTRLEEGDKNRNSRPVSIGDIQASVNYQAPYGTTQEGQEYIENTLENPLPPPDEYPTAITMLTAPVKYKIIKTAAEYNAFKKKAEGDYPKVDFNTKNFLILESDSNLPDNIFELTELKKEDGKNYAEFRVNIIALRLRMHSHTFLEIPKNVKEVELRQVL